MLSYQHGYHAGNAADVHKHRILAHLLQEMVAGTAEPIAYMETHSGRGVYDLADAQFSKTGEARTGILALPHADHDTLDPYFKVQHHTRARYGASWYGGSPQIARCILRPQDSLHLCELHPQEFAALRMRIKANNIRQYKKDGYACVHSLAAQHHHKPGFILIDPSYEVKSEYIHAAEFITTLHAKWPRAVILLWYPILEAALHEAMLAQLPTSALYTPWHHTYLFPKDTGMRMRGSGLYLLGGTMALHEEAKKTALFFT